MPGTTTPELEPFEQVTVQAQTGRVDRRDVGRRAEPRTEEAVGEARLGQPVEELDVPCPLGFAHRFDESRSVSRSRLGSEPAEGQCDEGPAGRRRRSRQHAQAAVVDRDRVALDHLVGREVLERDQPASVREPVGHEPRDLSGLERRCPLRTEQLKRVAKLRLADRVSFSEELPAGSEDRGRLVGRGDDPLEQPDDIGLLGIQGNAVAGEPRRLPSQLRERHRAESLRRVSNAGGRAADAGARRPGIEDLGRVTEVDLPRQEVGPLRVVRTTPRCLDEEVEAYGLTVGLSDEHQPACPKTGQQWLGRERREHRRDRGIDRVTSGRQGVRPCLSRDGVPCGCNSASHIGSELTL